MSGGGPWTRFGREGAPDKIGLDVSRPRIAAVSSTTKTPVQLFTRDQPGQYILAHLTLNIQATTIAQTITFYDVDGTAVGQPLVLDASCVVSVEYGKIAAFALSDTNSYTVQVTSVILIYHDPEKYALASAKFRIDVDFSPSGGTGVTDISSANTGIIVSEPTGNVVLTLGELNQGTLYGAPFGGSVAGPGYLIISDGSSWDYLKVTNNGGGMSIAIFVTGPPHPSSSFDFELGEFNGSPATLNGVPFQFGTAEAAGDLMYTDATGPEWTNLPIGTTGQVLTVVGGLPAWANASGGQWTAGAVSALGSGLNISGTTLNLPAPNFNRTEVSHAVSTNTGPKMFGLALSLTTSAQTSGDVEFEIHATVGFAAVASGSFQLVALTVKTSASALGDAATGTTLAPLNIGGTYSVKPGTTAGAESLIIPFSMKGIATGLSASMTYYFDLQITVVSTSNQTITVWGYARELLSG